MIARALNDLMALGASWVMLVATAVRGRGAAWRRLSTAGLSSHRVRRALAHQIEAGADVFRCLAFEPCGQSDIACATHRAHCRATGRLEHGHDALARAQRLQVRRLFPADLVTTVRRALDCFAAPKWKDR